MSRPKKVYKKDNLRLPKVKDVEQEFKHWEDLRDEAAYKRKQIKGITKNQERYINAIETSVMTFCTGVAGTGKTYIAAGMAVQMFEKGLVDKIVLCRPAVECGRPIGFMPGTAFEKIAPFLRPLLDALEDFLGDKEVDKMLEDGTLKVEPLGQMRGASFKHSIVLLDEAQNCDWTELKMFVTRPGENCTVVIMGDYSQSDLEKKDALTTMIDKLSVLTEISIIHLGIEDVVRSGLVRKILEVLDKD